MMVLMMIKSVVYASVCTVLLAATAASPGAAAANNPSAIQLADQGYKALAAGNAKVAVARYSDAIESRTLKPEDLARSLLNRALAFQTLGQNREAVDDYSGAMRIDALTPRMRAIALYNRGLAQQKLGLPARAIDDFTNALFLDAEFSQAYYSRANALRESGQYLFALSDYEKALRYKHPERHLPYYGEALTYQSLRHNEQAQKALLLALRINPTFKPAKDLLQKITRGGEAPAITQQKVLDLTTSQRQASVISGADDIVTGSLQPDQPDVVVRKAALPEAERPPVALLPESADNQVETASLVPASLKVKAPDVAADNPEVDAKDATARTVAARDTAAQDSQKPADDYSIQPVGWTVQLTSQRAPDAAWSVWKKLSARYGSLLSGAEPLVYKADLGDQGVFYRLRVHHIDSRHAAQSLCSKLKARGTSCFVSKAMG